MFDISELKIAEVENYVGMTKAAISKYFKNTNQGTISCNNRIVGIDPDSVASFLKLKSDFNFFKASITSVANLCGGVGKTSTTTNLAAAMSRVTSRSSDPIILLDADPQGSLTYILTGKQAKNNEPILIDYFEGKYCLSDIVNPIGNNVFLIKSNLNSAFLDKTLNRPSDIKNAMYKFYKDIFSCFGDSTKIFQNHTPQLSNLFASSICGMNQLSEDIICNVLIPIRSDDFALQGGKYIIDEINEIEDTYSFKGNNVRVNCFFSSLDRRISTSSNALKKAMSDEALNKYIAPVVIRYCAELPKCIANCNNVFSSGKKNNATIDYQELLQYIFS